MYFYFPAVRWKCETPHWWKRQRKKIKLASTLEFFFSFLPLALSSSSNILTALNWRLEQCSQSQNARGWVSAGQGSVDPPGGLRDLLPSDLLLGLLLNFVTSTRNHQACEGLQPVNTSGCPLYYLLIFPPRASFPHEAHPCKSDTFFPSSFLALIWRCRYGHLSLCGQVEALSPFPAEMGFIYRPLLPGLAVAVIVGQVLRVTHLSGDTMIHGSNSIPPTASRCVSACAVWVCGDRLSRFTPVSTPASCLWTGSSCRLNLMSGFVLISIFFAFFKFNFLSGAANVGARRPLINIWFPRGDIDLRGYYASAGDSAKLAMFSVLKISLYEKKSD